MKKLSNIFKKVPYPQIKNDPQNLENNLKIPQMCIQDSIKHPNIKPFKENIREILWECLLLPVWNVVVNVR